MDDKLNAALKGIWESLTDEQKEKAKTCKSWDELTALAGKEGIELPDEVLDAVAGGIPPLPQERVNQIRADLCRL